MVSTGSGDGTSKVNQKQEGGKKEKEQVTLGQNDMENQTTQELAQEQRRNNECKKT